MEANSFFESFKKLTDTQLLEIVSSHDGYEPNAITAAEQEIKRRGLTNDQINEINKEIKDAESKELKQKEKIDAVSKKVLSTGSSLAEDMYPIRKTPLTPDRAILLFSLFFATMFVISFKNGFEMLEFMFRSSSAKWDMSMVFFFVPFAITPIATVLFWLRKKWGWFLLAAYMAYTLCIAICSFIIQMRISLIDIPVVNFFRKETVSSSLLQILFFAGMLAAVCWKPLRNIYKVEKRQVVWTISIVAVLVLISYWNLLAF